VTALLEPPDDNVDALAPGVGSDWSADARWAAALADLEKSARALAAIPVNELAYAELGEGLLRLRQVTRVVEAATAEAGRRFTASDEWALDGARSSHAWLHGRGNDGYGSARALVERGRFIESFPAVAAAWREGAVASAHIDVLRAVYRRHPRLQSLLIEVDPDIAVVASEYEPMEFKQKLREICHQADPQAVDEADRERRKTTYFHASRVLDGFVRVDGMLDPVLGGQLLNALESARRALPDEPSGAGDDAFAHVSSPAGHDITGEHRPLGQLNLDALRRILDGAASVTGNLALPLVTGERPTVNVTVPLDALLNEDPATMGWLERFGLRDSALAVSSVRQIACDASLRPLVVDRQGQLVALLPRARTIHPALRRAVFQRDVRCRFPHCKHRIDEVHHIRYHSRGGPTEMGNLVGLCWFHHHAVHDKGWVIEGDPGGRLLFRSPTGRRASSDPPAARRPS